MFKVKSWLVVFAGFGVVGALGACSAKEEPAVPQSTRVWTGHIDGSDAKVGVAMLGEDVEVFACGGPESLDTLTTWLAGTGPVTRAAPLSDGEISIGFEPMAESLVGEIANADVTAQFLARPSDPGTLAGLYSADPRDIDGARLGLIVEQEPGAAPTGQGAVIRRVGTRRIFEQVNPVFPDIFGDPIFVTLPSAPDSLILVHRVVPGLE